MVCFVLARFPCKLMDDKSTYLLSWYALAQIRNSTYVLLLTNFLNNCT